MMEQFPKKHPTDEEYRLQVTPYLLRRACHLPGYNWIQDWWQYMMNNHPLFGICFHHRYHPLGRCVRIISLIGSILFGVAVTNIIFLAFVFYDQDYDKTYLELDTTSILGVEKLEIDENVKKATALAVTNGNLALWTVGAALHAVYDNLVWALATCACCSKSVDRTDNSIARFRASGSWLVMFLVVGITALATFAAAMRSAVAEYAEASTNAEKFGVTRADVVALKSKAEVNEYEFFIAYAIELVLNFFIFYPVVGTIIFSGCLTCGRTELLGGRPYELKIEAQAQGIKQAEEEEEQSMTSGSGSQRVTHKAGPRKEIRGSQKTSNRYLKGSNRQMRIAEKQQPRAEGSSNEPQQKRAEAHSIVQPSGGKPVNAQTRHPPSHPQGRKQPTGQALKRNQNNNPAFPPQARNPPPTQTGRSQHGATRAQPQARVPPSRAATRNQHGKPGPPLQTRIPPGQAARNQRHPGVQPQARIPVSPRGNPGLRPQGRVTPSKPTNQRTTPGQPGNHGQHPNARNVTHARIAPGINQRGNHGHQQIARNSLRKGARAQLGPQPQANSLPKASNTPQGGHQPPPQQRDQDPKVNLAGQAAGSQSTLPGTDNQPTPML